MVAIQEVLNILEPFDYINFSQASKRCRKLSTVKKPYKVFILIKDSPEILTNTDPILYGVRWTKEKEKDATRGDRPYPDQYHEIRVNCFENPLDSMKELYLYARSLMGIEIGFLAFRMSDFKGQCREIVDRIRSTFRGIHNLQINGKDQQQDELQYILDNMKYNCRLEILATTIERLPLKIPETIKQLLIDNGSWITLDYLMSLKMSTIELWNTNLTNEDMNVIFKSWMEMRSLQNLKSFEINLSNRGDFVEAALKDISYKKRPSITGRYSSYIREGPFEVTRKDGRMATIAVCEYPSEFFVAMRPQPPV
ncbi:hypothetical protein B9Z55_004341 [Caenorhabditis nigoni]|nr:hypothetical protein B9Z55_004341 [Caenorhabditis nigoni]